MSAQAHEDSQGVPDKLALAAAFRAQPPNATAGASPSSPTAPVAATSPAASAAPTGAPAAAAVPLSFGGNASRSGGNTNSAGGGGGGGASIEGTPTLIGSSPTPASTGVS